MLGEDGDDGSIVIWVDGRDVGEFGGVVGEGRSEVYRWADGDGACCGDGGDDFSSGGG